MGWLSLRAELRSEGIGRPLERLSDSLMPEDFIFKVVLARVAVTAPRNAVIAGREALTVQFETLRVSAIACFPVFGRGCQHFLRGGSQLRRVVRCVVTGV